MLCEKALLLTREQFDRAGRCVFELWVLSESGPRRLTIEDQKPVCFVRASDVTSLTERIKLQKINADFKSISLTSFNREPCFAIYSQSLKDYYAMRRLAKAFDIELLEDDIKPVDRYLMERFIKNGLMFQGQLGQPYSPKYLSVEKCQIKSEKLATAIATSFASVDIECDEAGELYSIGLHFVGTEQKRRVLYNLSGVEDKDAIDREHEYIEWLESPSELLLAFNSLIQLWDPDFIVGWNFVKFDIRVLVKAAKRCGIKLRLGRDGTEIRYSDGLRDNDQRYPDKCYLAGRVVLDGIEVLKNATYHFNSFSLNSVAQQLLGEEKLITGEAGKNKLEEIRFQYKHEPEKLAAYNLQDCELVSKIFRQEKLFEFLFTRAKLTGLELDRVGGSVAAFTNLYLPLAHRKGWIAPNLVAAKDYQHSPGGFVMESKPGIHKDVLVFDFKSLYPSIIRTFNVDPIALIEAEALQEEESIPGFRGGRFSRQSSILSGMLDQLWQAREGAKSANDGILSNAIKIIMNSFYGVLGSAGCRFYDTKLASSITMRGHWVLEQSRNWFESKGLEVIYGDTDSIFVCLDGTGIDATLAPELEAEMNAWWHTRLSDEFNLDSKLEMEFETHFAPFFMPTIRGTEAGSKKRYAGLKHTPEGEPRLIIKGLESVRSDWTELAKQFQTKLLTLIFAQQDCQEYINSIVNDLRAGKLDKLLIYSKRIRQPLSSYLKTTPPQIKAARSANILYGKEIYKKGSRIEYLMGLQGPVEASLHESAIDYEHYVEKQLLPIVSSILGNKSNEVSALFNRQQSLL